MSFRPSPNDKGRDTFSICARLACRFGRLPTTRAATTATAIRDGGKLSPSSDGQCEQRRESHALSKANAALNSRAVALESVHC